MTHRSPISAIFIFLLVFAAIGVCLNDWHTQAEMQLLGLRKDGNYVEHQAPIIVDSESEIPKIQASEKIEPKIARSPETPETEITLKPSSVEATRKM